MSDTPVTFLPPHVASAIDPEMLAKMDESCKLALSNQLNRNEQDPVLKALADKWKTMDAFSKREVGDKEISPKPNPVVRAGVTQIMPGQEAVVDGPATIYGGNVEIKDGTTNP